jgi:hypothetical protein
MGIFRNITKTLKKAAPLIGSAIGMYYGGSFGAALGSGIGSLASGRSAEEALKNAALTGAASYAMGGKDFGKDFDFKKYGTSGSPLRTMFQGADTSVASGGIKSAADKSFLSSLIPESTIGKVALAGGIGALAGGLGEEQMTGGFKTPEYAVGTTRLGTGRIGNKLYNLDDPDERRRYFEDNRKRQGAEDIESKEERDVFRDVVNPGIDTLRDPFLAASGGEVTGPGTGTSDSVPARLSDGEFVVTAKAVRGAGGGDRDVGAARMYDMMSQLERVA